MSVASPANNIPRQSVVGMEGMFVKMWDPPTENPATPDLMLPTNPVPEVMAAAGLQNPPSTPHTVERDLLHGADLAAWDGKEIKFFLFRDMDNPATAMGNFPGATIRVPRGAIFHGHTYGHGPPPHTIHWHGIEPTPINDGVGHCSMEIGNYTYQFQPNFIGFYFCHCHRNTVQHFEFGLYQALLVDPSDAFFATQWDPTIPIGAGRDGKRRVAANLSIIRGPGGAVPIDAASGAGFEGAIIPNPFPGFIGGLTSDPDPEAGNPALPAFLKFPVNPHAMTVPYDVEALWVVDDRDSVWSDEAPDARVTYPKHGSIPGLNDNFHGNAGGGTNPDKFFAFHDFNPDYWYVTGVSVPAAKGGVGTIPEGIVIPPALICGTATQVSVEAKVGQTILVRCLDAAYNNITVTFPVDVTIIAWDGRALGLAPYTQYNHAYMVPAGTPIHSSVARRFDALIKVDSPINDFTTVEFTDTRNGLATGYEHPLLMTARIPMNIGYGISGKVTNAAGIPLSGVTVNVTGGATPKTATTDAFGNYSVGGLLNGTYTVTPVLAGFTFAPATRTPAVPPDAVGQDFQANAVGGSIFGQVLDNAGNGIPNVEVILSGAAVATVNTDALGNFAFGGLADGTYRVIPFAPPLRFRTRRVAIGGGASVNVIFTAR